MLNELFQRFDIQVVINFAAESHVDRSIDDPAIFLKTNVLGTQTLLEAAKNHWKINPTIRIAGNLKTTLNSFKYLQMKYMELWERRLFYRRNKSSSE